MPRVDSMSGFAVISSWAPASRMHHLKFRDSYVPECHPTGIGRFTGRRRVDLEADVGCPLRRARQTAGRILVLESSYLRTIQPHGVGLTLHAYLQLVPLPWRVGRLLREALIALGV